MMPDRPSVTENPITVDAGHFQAEFSYFEYDRNSDRTSRSDTVSVLPANLKVGLLNNVDLQFIFTPYVNEQLKTGSLQSRDTGFGDDTEMRLKINFWGNDTPDPKLGDTAFGIIPFVKFPTGTGGLSNHHVEGGLIIPLVVTLPMDFALGTEAEFDFDYDDDDANYGVAFIHTITVDHDIPGVKALDAYIEYVGDAPDGVGATYRASASVGLIYTVTKNLSIDCGGTVGLSHDADDYTFFVGTSFRI